MKLELNLRNVEDYRTFLAVKQLPTYRIQGRSVWFPDEYAAQLGMVPQATRSTRSSSPGWMFDYQKAITTTALRKKKFAVFADCGLGKTAILLEFARQAAKRTAKPVLIVSPLNVCEQTSEEHKRFYGGGLEWVRSGSLPAWLANGKGIAITNYEAMKPGMQSSLGGLILDESSMLKSHYGRWSSACIELGRGVEYKLACTGTPAPNDRIEYANHAVFLDSFPTVNSFLATYFINRGQTQDRWALKPHALKPFYRALSHWAIFLTNPATYGWKDNCDSIPPIHTHIHDVDMTAEQTAEMRMLTGELFATDPGGIAKRSAFGQIGKGHYKGRQIDTNKPAAIRALVDSWDESTLVWCLYNEEQELIKRALPGAESISGATKYEDRMDAIRRFQSGASKVLISKPRILGFGLNLQVCTRQVFSGLEDSYESFYQAVKRSNRYGSILPLNVHIPVTDIEMPMVQNVLRKCSRVQKDTEEQELLFREMSKQ